MKNRIIEIIEDLTEFKELNKNPDIDLIENEILDSFAFIELIVKLNEEFNIEIQPTQVKPDTWRSIEKIVELVESLK